MNRKEISIFIAVIFIYILTHMFYVFGIINMPLKLFSTSIHESFHGLAALLTGGNAVKMELGSFGGRMFTSGGLFPIISISGYLGTAIIGATLLRFNSTSYLILIIALNIIFVTIYHGLFSVYYIILLITSGFLIGLALTPIKKFILYFISVYFFLSVFEDLFGLFFNHQNADSGILANYIGLNILSFPISIIYIGITIFIYFKILKGTFYAKKNN